MSLSATQVRTTIGAGPHPLLCKSGLPSAQVRTLCCAGPGYHRRRSAPSAVQVRATSSIPACILPGLASLPPSSLRDRISCASTIPSLQGYYCNSPPTLRDRTDSTSTIPSLQGYYCSAPPTIGASLGSPRRRSLAKVEQVRKSIEDLHRWNAPERCFVAQVPRRETDLRQK